MEKEIAVNKQFYILSRSIDNAEICTVTELMNGCIKVRLRCSRKYEQGCSAELFSFNSSDRLYFETIVKEAADDELILWHPFEIKHLQRREYARISETGSIFLSASGEEISAEISNISPGGMQIKSDCQPVLLKLYKTKISMPDVSVNADFRPLRIETSSGRYIISGSFASMDNKDRIELAQYCFKKQIENIAGSDVL